jgi:MFS family permease
VVRRQAVAPKVGDHGADADSGDRSSWWRRHRKPTTSSRVIVTVAIPGQSARLPLSPRRFCDKVSEWCSHAARTPVGTIASDARTSGRSSREAHHIPRAHDGPPGDVLVTNRTAVMWRTVRDPVLGRLELAFAGFSLAEHGGWLALLVYAFDRGGAGEAGAVGLAGLVPAVFAAPVAGYLGDRFPPHRAVPARLRRAGRGDGCNCNGSGSRTTADRLHVRSRRVHGDDVHPTGDGPPAPRRRPSPPADLVAANVAIGFVQNIGRFAGPLIAGTALAVASPGAAFGVFAMLLGGAVILTRRVGGTATWTSESRSGPWSADVAAGLRTLREEGALCLLVAIVSVAAVVSGALDVIVVAFADSRLGGGGEAAALLGAAIGLGAICGSLVVSGLIGGARLLPYLVVSSIALGAPLIALAGVDGIVLALALFAVVGLGNRVVGVIGSAALQRQAPGRVLARVFGSSSRWRCSPSPLGRLSLRR